MKKLFSAFLLIAFAIYLPGQTPIPAGNVSGIWTKANSPYQVNGNILVPMAQTLTIEKGVQVIFQGKYGINVRGKLIAIGEVGDSIRFTRNDTAGFYKTNTGDGGWAGIKINNYDFSMSNLDTSIFRFCIFEYGKAFGTGDYAVGGALGTIYADWIKIDDCDFRYNMASDKGGALVLNGNEITVNRCRFYRNQANLGGAISVQYGVKGNLNNNILIENKAWTNGGAYYSFTSRGVISNNIFANNLALNSGGAMMLDVADETFFGNVIVNNEALVIAGAISLKSASPQMINNTIVNNRALWTGAIDISGLCNAKFYNTIIWGNYSTGIPGYSQMAFVDASTQPNFYNCVVMDGLAGIYKPTNSYVGDFINCVNINPDFVSPTAGNGKGFPGISANWNLKTTSPCINMGTNDPYENGLPDKDYYSKNRILNGIVDQGAAETHIQKKTVSGVISSNTIWIADSILVTGDITINDNTTLTISPGTLVQFQGYYRITVNGTIIAKGSEKNKITFTIKDTTGFHNVAANDGSWFGIIFQNDAAGMNGQMSDNDSSFFDYCVFEYAKDLENQFIRANGGAIKCAFVSKLSITNSLFRFNKGLKGGAIGLSEISSPIIKNNTFYANYSLLEGGAIAAAGFSTPLISGNIISNNIVNNSIYSTGGGIYLTKSNATVINNIICNNYAKENGGGVQISYSTPLFVNNTIVNNKARIGGGICTGWCIPLIQNSIIYGNKAIDAGDNFFILTESIRAEKCLFKLSTAVNVKASDCIGLVEYDPDFINPSADAGVLHNGLSADWRISDFSPAINKGADLTDITLAEYQTDYDGNARVNHGTVDIGAYESQASPIVITEQPFNFKGCLGDTILFTFKTNVDCKYQWLKNGKLIPGENNDTLMITNAAIEDEADYTCILMNGYGLVNTNNASASIGQAPELLVQPSDQWAIANMPLKLESSFTGSNPISFQWYRNNVSLPLATKPLIAETAFSPVNEGYYQCKATNLCGSATTDSIKVFLAPQICMVTVDSASGKNLIVWDDNSSLPIAKYNVYREGIAKGVYEKLGEVKPGSYTLFRDSLANPQKQAYWYKITAVDSTGTESDIDACIPHKTIHLLTTLGYQGGVQLDWDGYYGYPFGTYEIMRSTDGGKTFTKADLIASSNQTWSDLSASKYGNRYFVSVLKTTPCNATMMKAESGPYAQSLSNIAEFKATELPDNTGLPVSVFPNPFSESFTLEFMLQQNSDVIIEVINPNGQISAVLSYNNLAYGNHQLLIDANAMNISEGMAFIRIIANKETSIIKIQRIK